MDLLINGFELESIIKSQLDYQGPCIKMKENQITKVTKNCQALLLLAFLNRAGLFFRSRWKYPNLESKVKRLVVSILYPQITVSID